MGGKRWMLGLAALFLLCGPVWAQSLGEVARKERQRRAESERDVGVIREQEPESASSIFRGFRGDIETILAKALEKEPERRYGSPAELAADLRRHLADEPILARKPSTLYQIRKFTRRNRVLVGGMTATFLALLAGLVGTTRGYFEARAAADRSIRWRPY